MKKILSPILTVVFIAIFVIYFFTNRQDFEGLKQVSALSLLAIVIFQYSGMFLNAVFLKIILVPFKKIIKMADAWFVTVVSTIGNFFTPFRGGAAIRAVYLKKKLSLNYSKFLVTLSGNYIISFLINALVGIVALQFLPERASMEYWILLAFLGTMVVVSVLLITVGLPRKQLNTNHQIKFLRHFLNALQDVQSGWNDLVKDRTLLLNLIYITLANLVIAASIVQVALMAIGQTVSLAGLFLYASLGSLSLFISITPGSIGIKEGILVYTASVIGLDTATVLSVAVIERGVMFITLALGWGATRLFNVRSHLEITGKTSS